MSSVNGTEQVVAEVEDKGKAIKAVYDRLKAWQDGRRPYFIGAYVHDMRDLAIASVVSRQHASFQSKPGWGKTDVLSNIARAIAGADHFNRLDISPSSSPTLFIGVDDLEVMLKESRQVKVVDGTPYDPDMRIVLADELFRGNEPTFDAALHALDPQKQSHCVVWAANNFVAKGDRVEALLDRVGLWYWHPGETLDASALVEAMMGSVGKPQVPGWMPTWQEVEVIRSAKPGPQATAAVKAAIETLLEEATAAGFAVGHPRSIAQWWQILYYAGVLYSGDEDFDKVPAEAMRLLRFAYGAKSYDEAAAWANLCTAIVDRVQAEIDRILAENIVEFRRVASIRDAAERRKEAGNLGAMLAAAQETLFAQFGDGDPKVEAAMETISRWQMAAILGNVDKVKQG